MLKYMVLTAATAVVVALWGCGTTDCCTSGPTVHNGQFCILGGPDTNASTLARIDVQADTCILSTAWPPEYYFHWGRGTDGLYISQDILAVYYDALKRPYPPNFNGVNCLVFDQIDSLGRDCLFPGTWEWTGSMSGTEAPILGSLVERIVLAFDSCRVRIEAHER